jgi:hypothetical protein
MNEARRGTLSAAKKKQLSAAKKKINKIVSDGLEEYFANYDDEGAEDAIRDQMLGEIGYLIDTF